MFFCTALVILMKSKLLGKLVVGTGLYHGYINKKVKTNVERESIFIIESQLWVAILYRGTGDFDEHNISIPNE